MLDVSSHERVTGSWMGGTGTCGLLVLPWYYWDKGFCVCHLGSVVAGYAKKAGSPVHWFNSRLMRHISTPAVRTCRGGLYWHIFL
jgi:hypothetical protein